MMSCVNDALADDSLFLADLLPSIAAHLGLAGRDRDPLLLPEFRRYVVVLVDGLGWDIALAASWDAPYIASVIGDGRKAAVRVPTTTAASLMSLWTGLAPGSHGVVGYSFEMPPDEARFAADYPWITTPLYLDQPLAAPGSILDELVDAGVAVTCVMPTQHLGSGLTAMATRRAKLVGLVGPGGVGDDMVTLVRDATRAGERSLVYAYDARLDRAAHAAGVDSHRWRRSLARVDELLENLRASLDDDVCLIVTGDHGMVDVAQADRVVIDADPALRRDVRLIGGEARCRHLYTSYPRAVQERWQDAQGDAAMVLVRDEVVDRGLMGPVATKYLSRIGDVVVVATGKRAYLTTTFPKEFSLVGMHGGATAAERYVPVLID
jgi:hypothetical protein